MNRFRRRGVCISVTGDKYRATALAVLALAGAVAAHAQLAFDVASVRENTNPGAPQQLRRTPDGGLTAQRFPARFLVTIAYGLQPFQLIGMPSWSSATYYDITAKPAPGSPTTRDQMSEMLQALLVDRFTLQFRRESRQIDGFALVRLKPGALGPSLKPSDIDCEKTPAERRCNVMVGAGSTFVIAGASMWPLIQRLVPELNAPVVDETGLTGTYDIALRWSADATASSEFPAVPTALQEQLGLRLERRRVEVDMFVVERFERPTPN